ncbi:unnamed protein product, partial [Ectocarpus sp. 12 AP-2014]
QLSQRWPAELEVTADQIKKMYTNEKRRMKTKAQRAAATAAAAAVVGAVPDGDGGVGGGGGGGSGPTLVTNAPTMSAEPPRGVRFDAPPAFDHRAFNEDVAEEEPPVTVW